MIRFGLSILLAAAGVSSAAEVRVSIRAAASATGIVTVGDVARIKGEGAEQLAKLSITPSNGRVATDEVVAVLVDAGVGRHELLVRGPDACVVQLRDPVAPTIEPTTDEWSGLAAVPAARSVESTGSTSRDIKENQAGPQRLAKLIRPVARGVLIREADVTFVQQADPLNRFADAATVVGQRATRRLDVGHVVRPQDMSAPLMVRRGQRVKVALSSGGVVVHSIATSREDGGFGQTVRCRVDATGEELRVTVTGPGTGTVAF
ncbi:MAG: flagellar basal body P-ring formation chaperone FlgA [Planctomycetota bacterium]